MEEEKDADTGKVNDFSSVPDVLPIVLKDSSVDPEKFRINGTLRNSNAHKEDMA
jgi:hypothetical protein